MSADGMTASGPSNASAKADVTSPDWPAIEREFRAGQLSIREIAKQHGITDTAIRNHAKRQTPPWTRDLSAAVRSRVREDLVRDSDSVRANQLAGVTPSDEAIVDAAAARGVEVVRIHRRGIEALRKEVAELVSQLGLRGPPEEGHAQGEHLLKITERSRVIADLSQAMARLVPLERVAWALDEEKDPLTGISDADLASMINALKSQLAPTIPARI